jgi:hypothetical protein
MELCAALGDAGGGCVATGRAVIAPHALWTAHLGTCAAAACAGVGACALVHFDETAAGMAHSTHACAVEMAARAGARAWEVRPGVWCDEALGRCVAALEGAGATVRVLSPRRAVGVAPVAKTGVGCGKINDPDGGGAARAAGRR